MPQADQVTAANYDAKKFKICCPWNNKRGASWTLVFKPAFEDGCRAQVDQFASWHQMLVTETDFGVLCKCRVRVTYDAGGVCALAVQGVYV